MVYLIIHNKGRKSLLNVRNNYLDHSHVETSKFVKHISVGENGTIYHGLKCINCYDGRKKNKYKNILCDLTKTLPLPWLFVESEVKSETLERIVPDYPRGHGHENSAYSRSKHQQVALKYHMVPDFQKIAILVYKCK